MYHSSYNTHESSDATKNRSKQDDTKKYGPKQRDFPKDQRAKLAYRLLADIEESGGDRFNLKAIYKSNEEFYGAPNTPEGYWFQNYYHNHVS
mmetsp:Transcript_20012/g.30085  ORF Transcript_20012/g.30085 Transcript_20012/m.30085 type:complete len:92 (+) Transcript_20012:300-575(+)